MGLIKNIIQAFKAAITGSEKDFTSGSIKRAVFLLAVPMILEMFMESAFALADILFVSSIGVDAVATVGLTESVVTLVYAVAIGLSMGATAMVSRRIGEKDVRGAEIVAVQAISLGVIVSVIIGVIGVFFSKEVLSLMGAEPEVVESGFRYTQIILGSNVVIMLLFLINAIFRGAGEASIAMWLLVFSNLFNIILDPMLIFGIGPFPEMGVTGAAVATVTGRSLAVLSQLAILFFGWSKIKLSIKNFVIDVKVMIRLVKISLGGIGQFIIGTSSWIVLMRIISVFGTEVIAGYTIAIRVMLFTLMPSWGMSNAAATLVGQNLGAKQPERAEKSVWLTSKYNAIFMAIVSVLYLVFAPYLISLFSTESAVVHYGALSLRVIALGYVFYAYGMVVSQSFNGAGDTKTPTIINFICFWIYQLPLAYFTAIVLNWGPVGVLIGITSAEVLIAIMSIYWFRKGKWKKIEV
ncbi:MATE family efflux transporter [Saprospiraceae bacterium]|nr:MATE family efflux transporter [Saprospiraceae bacterium]